MDGSRSTRLQVPNVTSTSNSHLTCGFCDKKGHSTSTCNEKRQYRASRRQGTSKGRVKEVREGEESTNISETEEELEKEGNTNLEEPEEIGRLEEMNSFPDFLRLGVRC